MSVSAHRVSSRIGAVISGVDLNADPTPSVRAAVRDALNTHKAIVFQGVSLDDAGQQRVASWFGELTAAHPTVPAVAGTRTVLPVDSETSKANAWHSDVTFVVNPPQVSTLRSIVTTPYGGETLIANAAAAYRDLPDPLRRLADSLWAVHSNQFDYARPEPTTEAQRAHDEVFVSTTYEAEHPLVRVHPLTGERGLFIGGFVRHIIGLSSSESTALLSIFQSYVTRPENVLRWRWSPGELVVFDNRITQHYAIDNYDDLPRRLNRVTVAGDIPRSVEGERSRQRVGDASHYSPILELVA